MILIKITNDGTANTEENLAHPPNAKPFYLLGNYDYEVSINDEVLERGKLMDCFRFHGWQGILSCLDKEVNGDKFRE